MQRTKCNQRTALPAKKFCATIAGESTTDYLSFGAPSFDSKQKFWFRKTHRSTWFPLQYMVFDFLPIRSAAPTFADNRVLIEFLFENTKNNRSSSSFTSTIRHINSWISFLDIIAEHEYFKDFPKS